MDNAMTELMQQGVACHVVRDYINHFANPVRLRVLCELVAGERSVTELVEATGARQSTVSQQLNLLRLGGLVDRTRVGSKNMYRIVDPLAVETMQFLFSLAEKLLARQPSTSALDETACA